MEVAAVRPGLVAFRVIRYSGENSRSAPMPASSKLRVTQAIELGWTYPVPEAGVSEVALSPKAVVRILRSASAITDDGVQVLAQDAFVGEYEGKFVYPLDVTSADLEAVFETEAHQYLLVAQSFPLAMTHRSELRACH